MSLLKLQRSALTEVVGVITGHCIMGTQTRPIGLGYLANDFCGSCRNEKEKETVKEEGSTWSFEWFRDQEIADNCGSTMGLSAA